MDQSSCNAASFFRYFKGRVPLPVPAGRKDELNWRRLIGLLAAGATIAGSPLMSWAGETMSRSEVARELGWMLSWRLGPEIVEEKCRGIHPEGNEARAQALEAWREKNAATISAVDGRVIEVVSRLFPTVKPEDSAAKLAGQIKALFLQENIPASKADDSLAFCKAEADPKSSRWNSTGMPHVQESLAALYDWLVQQKVATP